MNKEIDLGKVWLPQKLIDMVENHRKNLLEHKKGSADYDMLLKADFSMYFSDFMIKSYGGLKER